MIGFVVVFTITLLQATSAFYIDFNDGYFQEQEINIINRPFLNPYNPTQILPTSSKHLPRHHLNQQPPGGIPPLPPTPPIPAPPSQWPFPPMQASAPLAVPKAATTEVKQSPPTKPQTSPSPQPEPSPQAVPIPAEPAPQPPIHPNPTSPANPAPKISLKPLLPNLIPKPQDNLPTPPIPTAIPPKKEASVPKPPTPVSKDAKHEETPPQTINITQQPTQVFSETKLNPQVSTNKNPFIPHLLKLKSPSNFIDPKPKSSIAVPSQLESKPCNGVCIPGPIEPHHLAGLKNFKPKVPVALRPPTPLPCNGVCVPFESDNLSEPKKLPTIQTSGLEDRPTSLPRGDIPKTPLKANLSVHPKSKIASKRKSNLAIVTVPKKQLKRLQSSRRSHKPSRRNSAAKIISLPHVIAPSRLRPLTNRPHQNLFTLPTIIEEPPKQKQVSSRIVTAREVTPPHILPNHENQPSPNLEVPKTSPSRLPPQIVAGITNFIRHESSQINRSPGFKPSIILTGNIPRRSAIKVLNQQVTHNLEIKPNQTIGEIHRGNQSKLQASANITTVPTPEKIVLQQDLPRNVSIPNPNPSKQVLFQKPQQDGPELHHILEDHLNHGTQTLNSSQQNPLNALHLQHGPLQLNNSQPGNIQKINLQQEPQQPIPLKPVLPVNISLKPQQGDQHLSNLQPNPPQQNPILQDHPQKVVQQQGPQHEQLNIPQPLIVPTIQTDNAPRQGLGLVNATQTLPRPAAHDLPQQNQNRDLLQQIPSQQVNQQPNLPQPNPLQGIPQPQQVVFQQSPPQQNISRPEPPQQVPAVRGPLQQNQPQGPSKRNLQNQNVTQQGISPQDPQLLQQRASPQNPWQTLQQPGPVQQGALQQINPQQVTHQQQSPTKQNQLQQAYQPEYLLQQGQMGKNVQQQSKEGSPLQKNTPTQQNNLPQQTNSTKLNIPQPQPNRFQARPVIPVAPQQVFAQNGLPQQNHLIPGPQRQFSPQQNFSQPQPLIPFVPQQGIAQIIPQYGLSRQNPLVRGPGGQFSAQQNTLQTGPMKRISLNKRPAKHDISQPIQPLQQNPQKQGVLQQGFPQQNPIYQRFPQPDYTQQNFPPQRYQPPIRPSSNRQFNRPGQNLNVPPTQNHPSQAFPADRQFQPDTNRNPNFIPFQQQQQGQQFNTFPAQHPSTFNAQQNKIPLQYNNPPYNNIPPQPIYPNNPTYNNNNYPYPTNNIPLPHYNPNMYPRLPPNNPLPRPQFIKSTGITHGPNTTPNFTLPTKNLTQPN